MKKVFLIFVIATASCLGMTSIRSIQELKVPEAQGNQILIVFDIDDTLTILSDPAFHRPNFKAHHSGLFAKIMDPLSIKERTVAFTLPLLTTPGDLIENDSPKYIQAFQNLGHKTLGLTAAMAGEIDALPVEDRRIAELQRVGIDFSHSFAEFPEMIFSCFKTPIFGKPPVFKRGILFTNEVDKGEVLIAFLKGLSWKPEHIVFVDDRMDHLHAVERALAQYDSAIQYHGFHYQTNPNCYQDIKAELFEERWVAMAQWAQAILKNEER